MMDDEAYIGLCGFLIGLGFGIYIGIALVEFGIFS